MANAKSVASRPPAPKPAPLPLADERKAHGAIMELIDKAKPDVFAKVVAGQISTGTITATTFNLVDLDSRRLATLGTTTSGAAGLALFRPGSDRAVVELMLAEDGPALRLNNVKGYERLRLAVRDGLVSVTLLDEHGHLRAGLLVDHGRPHIFMVPRGAKKRHVVTATRFDRLPAPRAAWARAMRAARTNKHAAFDAAVRDA